MKEYIKVEDLMKMFDLEISREDQACENMMDRIEILENGGEDKKGRSLEWLQKMEYKHDQRASALEHMKFKIKAFLSE